MIICISVIQSFFRSKANIYVFKLIQRAKKKINQWKLNFIINTNNNNKHKPGKWGVEALHSSGVSRSGSNLLIRYS